MGWSENRKMSTSPSTLPNLPTDGVLRALRRPIEAAAFWLGVALPFAYLPVLAFGIEQIPVLPLVGLLAANLVALVVGHGYAQE